MKVEDRQAARAPLASLLGKSEKALGKLAAGTWQHARLRDQVEALALVLALLDDGKDSGSIDPARLAKAAETFAAMIERTAGVRTKFAAGTSQRTLQENRLRALQVGEALLGRREAR